MQNVAQQDNFYISNVLCIIHVQRVFLLLVYCTIMLLKDLSIRYFICTNTFSSIDLSYVMVITRESCLTILISARLLFALYNKHFTFITLLLMRMHLAQKIDNTNMIMARRQ